ncbi:putative RNA-directed DNA polymerase from transposon X-element [Trichonephila clavipes]|nr:putative RNA-directed DNA polymerase from transposon X-element [Trichonephila clavipes]
MGADSEDENEMNNASLVPTSSEMRNIKKTQTQLLPSISSKTSTTSDPQPPTPMSETKGKIKEQPSQLHRPRKDSKIIDLLSIKPTTNLKKNPAKNTSLKIAREQDSPNETSPVSKKSRRRKTFKTSDAMDTDANPSDSDYVIDLAICSPSLFPNLNLSVEKDLYNSDHFPVILSHDSDTGGKTFPPTYSYGRADWALFTQLAVIPDAMVKTESIDTAVQEVTNVLIAAADLSIPKVSSHSFQRYKPWWNTDCQTAYKNQRKLWGIFRRYPTKENLLAFKKAKSNARRVRRQSQRQSWIRYVSSLTSSTSSKQLWKKVKAANGIYREFSFPILQTSNSVFSSPVEIANILGETFQSVSSTASYSSRFLEIKRRAERNPITFSTCSFFPYN